MLTNKFIKTQKVSKFFDEEITSSALLGKVRDYEYNSCANTFELRSCDKGNLIYLDPEPTPDMMDIIYSSEFLPFQFDKEGGFTKYIRDFLQYRKAKSIMKLSGKNQSEIKVLDAGSGSGVFLRILKKIIGSSKNLYGNDFSEKILEPLKHEGFGTIPGNLDNFSTNEKFDVITMFQVIEHLYDPLKAVRKLSAALNDGGYLFIETPSIDSLDAKVFSGGYWDGYQIPRHLWLFNEKSLGELASLANLSVKKVQYFPYPIFWIHSIRNFFLDKNYPRIAWFFTYRNPILLIIFTMLDTIIWAFYGKTSNMRVILQKAK